MPTLRNRVVHRLSPYESGQLGPDVHLGDYIYEGKAGDNQVRKHVGPELMTLEDYRARYALYKSDLDLHAAHQAAPWLVTWDDHEFDCWS